MSKEEDLQTQTMDQWLPGAAEVGGGEWGAEGSGADVC